MRPGWVELGLPGPKENLSDPAAICQYAPAFAWLPLVLLSLALTRSCIDDALELSHGGD